MKNGEIGISTNEQIQLIEDKNTSLSMRTKESLKTEFKAIEGCTDNDKLVKLLELYRKFQTTQDKFNIDTNLDVIEKAFNTMKSQLNAITSNVNQYERTLNEKYIVDVADEMKLLKEQIESEEVLNARIITLKKELELLSKRFEEKESIVLQSKEKIETLETNNKTLINKNSDLVHKESEYINQLREKDKEINTKDLEKAKLMNEYEIKIKSLEKQYKEDKEQLEKQHREDIKQLKEEHRNEIKVLEKEVLEVKDMNNAIAIEKAKLDAKIENLEANVNILNKNKESLEMKIIDLNTEMQVNLKLLLEEKKATKNKKTNKSEGR